MRIRVKVCGIMRREDAEAAADLGADALGFNFVPESPRRLFPDQVREIARALPPFVVRVGVFADERIPAIEATALLAGVQCVQLHGDETPEACATLTLPWYKAHRVRPGFQTDEVARWRAPVFLLDAWSPAVRGGTGRTFDWSVARRAAAYGRVILAGGLTPDNIEAAIAAALPYAVDVSSGIESSPGRKDRGRMREFMRRVRRAEAALLEEGT